MRAARSEEARSGSSGFARCRWWRGMAVAVLLAGVVMIAPSTASAATPAAFGGTVEEFYVVPDPLPPGTPGDLIRVQDVSSGGGRTTRRIMYHSRDAADRDRAVTGIVTYPDGPTPPGGWPVVSLANGTVGLSSSCALSRHGNPAPTFGIDGVGVASDYIGLGPVGEIHPYLSRPSEAHSVIDAVRAARNLSESGAGPRWVTIGGSQGGHAAIATNELAESYAPELHLLGTVALAPAAMFDRVYGPIDEIVTHIVGVMALYGAATEHPEIDPGEYVGSAVAEVAATVFPVKCLGDIIAALAPIPSADFYVHDPMVTEPARSISLANDVGHVAAESPLLLVTGTADMTVVIDRGRDLFARLCASGQVTEYTEYEGANHDDIGTFANDQIRLWLAARVAGQPANDSCPPAEPATTTTTTSITTSSAPSTATSLPVSEQAVLVATTPKFTG